jgi:hypothetical protein
MDSLGKQREICKIDVVKFALLFCFKLSLLISVTSQISFGQERFRVIAEQGLICRDQPSLEGERVAKLPYGTVVELMKNTKIRLTISDSISEIKGEWWKILYYGYPYVYSESVASNYDDSVYVFSAFLKPMQSAKIEMLTLPKSEYLRLKKTAKSTEAKKPTEISTFNVARFMLQKRVTWTETEYEPMLSTIQLANGQVLKVRPDSWDNSFVAYYPEEEVLFFEGGHSSDVSFSLKTGETTQTVGSPQYVITSPNGKFRLNAWFPGQECYDYFFQEITATGFNYLTNFGWGSEFGENVCTFDYFGWISDTEFIYGEFYNLML